MHVKNNIKLNNYRQLETKKQDPLETNELSYSFSRGERKIKNFVSYFAICGWIGKEEIFPYLYFSRGSNFVQIAASRTRGPIDNAATTDSIRDIEARTYPCVLSTVARGWRKGKGWKERCFVVIIMHRFKKKGKNNFRASFFGKIFAANFCRSIVRRKL